MRKIAGVVHRQMSSTIEVDDLVQVGLMALVESAPRFEDRNDLASIAYVRLRVKGAMIDYLRSLAPVSRRASRQRRNFGAVRKTLLDMLGRAPTDPEMAKAVDMDVASYQSAASGAVPPTFLDLDAAYSDYKSAFADESPDSYDVLEHAQVRQHLASAIRSLPPKEALVLNLYFFEELGLEEIGEVLGVQGSRICHIKKAAIDKLKPMMASWAS